jgi:hypothetical protein
MIWRHDGPRTLYCADGSRSKQVASEVHSINARIDLETGKYWVCHIPGKAFYLYIKLPSIQLLLSATPLLFEACASRLQMVILCF